MRRAFFALTALLALSSFTLAKPYTVQPGDSLYSIAKANNVSLTRLLMINKLSGEHIQAGQVLEIPSSETQPRLSNRNQNNLSSDGTGVRRTAYRFIGSRYIYGSSGPYSFDCSGFTRYVLKRFGVDLPHSAVLQSRTGRSVRRNGLLPGDLVFFNTNGRGISHVALYVGNNTVVHATNPHQGVVSSSLSDRYWGPRYVSARRVM